MILTDKTKEDFLEWYGSDEKYFQTTPTKTEEYANVIEWLDSIGIHVHIEPNIGCGPALYYPMIIWRDHNFIDRYISIGNSDYFNSRQEATKAAIEKANEIYNSQHLAQ